MSAALFRMHPVYAVLVFGTLYFISPVRCDHSYCCPGKSCYPSSTVIDAFGNTLDGRILKETSVEYENTTIMYNTVEYKKPDLVVMVNSVGDIQKAVLFAKLHNLLVTVRSSGHDFSGRSTADKSFNINLSEMKAAGVILSSTRHASGELKVQTGKTWIEIYELLDGYDRVIVGGSGKTVTTGGYTLGGGHSPISKSHGLAVDNLLEMQLVLPDGRIATCNESHTVIENVDGTTEIIEDGDLFWAVRGGGGGTFGVTVYNIFKLHPQPASMVLLTVTIPLKFTDFSMDKTEEVFAILQNFNNLPDEWGGYWLVNNWDVNYLPEDTGLGYLLRTTGTVTLHINKFAPWDGTENDTFSELIAYCQANSIPVFFTNQSSFYEYAKLAGDPPSVRTSLATTLLQPEKQNDQFIAFMKNQLFDVFKDDNIYLGCTAVLLGGRVKDFATDSAPLSPGFRTASSSLACGVGLPDPDDEDAIFEKSIISLGNEFSEGLQSFGDGMYLNEPTKAHTNWKEDFWGNNYNRLLNVKNRYDPGNFFTCHHCVKTDVDAGKLACNAASFSSSGLYIIVLIFLYTFLK